VPARVVWKLRELLETEKVTPYRLLKIIHQDFGPVIDKTALYRLVNGTPKRAELESIAAILSALETITSKAYRLEDLMYFENN
jgi:Cro/C1-type HTH DNA-binding domain